MRAVALPPCDAHGSCGSYQPGARGDHQIPASPAHHHGLQHDPVAAYTIRISGRLGATALSAFPTMASELKGGETVLTGMLDDRAALFGVLAQIEALGLELLEVRQVTIIR